MNEPKLKRGKVTAWGVSHQCDLCSNPASVRWTRAGEVYAAACSLHRDEVKRLLYRKHGGGQ